MKILLAILLAYGLAEATGIGQGAEVITGGDVGVENAIVGLVYFVARMLFWLVWPPLFFLAALRRLRSSSTPSSEPR
jgi:hypothetical protein